MNTAIRNPRKVYASLLSAFRCSHKIVPFYNPKFTKVLLKALRLLCMRGFDPHEALQLGLLEMSFPESHLSKVTSKREMDTISASFNPAAYEVLTSNKSIFYLFCKALGIPVPKLYAIFFRDTPGYGLHGEILSSRENWQTFISNTLPSEFIIKPAKGTYGSGIVCFSRNGERDFVDIESEKQYNADEIYNMMYSYSKDDCFVIQERLMSHPEFTRLSDTESLQTLRIVTFVDNGRQSHILHAFFKPIVGRNIIDNHIHGLTGNLLAQVNVHNGTLNSAVKLTPNYSGIVTVARHPKTGIPFEGFVIPMWDAATSLAKEVSLKFLPLRIIGWDIAITPKGPCILEGNAYADPPSFHMTMDVVLSEIYKERQKCGT